jgi:hypothetical protein
MSIKNTRQLVTFLVKAVIMARDTRNSKVHPITGHEGPEGE